MPSLQIQAGCVHTQTTSNRGGDFFSSPHSFSGFVLPQFSRDRLICSFPRLATVFLGCILFPHIPPPLRKHIWIWEEASPTLIVWEQLIQSPSFANKNAEAQGREGASLKSPRKPEARLGLWTSDAPNLLRIPTPQDPGWEINGNQALELWGDCRHFINIQMRETFRPLLSLFPIPFFTGGWLPPLLGAGKDLLVNWAVNKPFCMKI